MTAISDYNVRVLKDSVDPEIHKTKEAKRLKESCQQFESIFLAEIWKKMGTLSRKISGKDDSDRPFAQMEDLALEMSAEELSKSGGMGVWKSLYDSLIPQLESNLKGDAAAILKNSEAVNLSADLQKGVSSAMKMGEAANAYSKSFAIVN